MGHEKTKLVGQNDENVEETRRSWVRPTIVEHGNLSELIRGFSGPDCDSGGLAACNLDAGDPCSGASGQCL